MMLPASGTTVDAHRDSPILDSQNYKTAVREKSHILNDILMRVLVTTYKNSSNAGAENARTAAAIRRNMGKTARGRRRRFMVL